MNGSSRNVLLICILLLLGLALLYSASTCNLTCPGRTQERYGDYNTYCRWDSRRFCTMQNGNPGKCVMNGLCVPQMLAYTGPDLQGTPATSPVWLPHSPVSPTWEWNAPTLDTLEPVGEVDARDNRNDFSNRDVMQYVNELGPPSASAPPPPIDKLPETLEVISSNRAARARTVRGQKKTTH